MGYEKGGLNDKSGPVMLIYSSLFSLLGSTRIALTY